MYMDIAGRIKKFRSEEKLTQARLAELLNVSRQTVGAWEQGRALPDVEMLRGISEALHRDMLCFFGTPQGEDEQRCSCIRMIEDLCGEKDTAHFAWQEDVPSGADYQGGIYVSGKAMRFDENGADYQGVAVTAEAYRENGFYYCIPFIKNNGSENSGQITLMRSLDILLPETHLQYESINGDSADGASFFPVYRELNTGGQHKRVCAHRPPQRGGVPGVCPALRHGKAAFCHRLGGQMEL